jgi:hypothetical protein
MSLYYVQQNVFDNKTTYTKVLCKDGSYKNQPSRVNTMYDDACKNNGGRDTEKARQEAQKQIEEAIKQQANQNTQAPTKNRDSISKSLFKKIAGAYNQNLIIAGLLVAGYFAYKKYKK